MGPFLIKVVINAVALWVATLIVPGVDVTGSTGHKIGTLLLVGAIFGVINAFVKPIVRFLSLPFYLLTLGLIAFVVNAVLLELVSWFAGKLDIAFHIKDFFWSAIGAAIVVSLVSMVLNIVIPDRD